MATLNAGKGGAHASYYHRANKQVRGRIHSTHTLFYTKLPVFWVCVVAIVPVDVVVQIQVGVEFEASTRTQETTASFGYRMELPEANMVFRGKDLFP